MSNSKLREYEGIGYIKDDRTIVNIIPSDKGIGGKLHMYTKFDTVVTLIGDINCVKSAMDFLTTPNYDRGLLTKKNFTKRDIDGISKKRLSVPNLWSIMVHIVWERIVNDEELLKEFLALPKDTIFTSYSKVTQEYKGETVELIDYNKKMNRYIAIIRLLKEEFHKENGMDDLNMLRMMEFCKDKTDKLIFEDLPVEISVPEKYNL